MKIISYISLSNFHFLALFFIKLVSLFFLLIIYIYLNIIIFHSPYNQCQLINNEINQYFITINHHIHSTYNNNKIKINLITYKTSNYIKYTRYLNPLIFSNIYNIIINIITNIKLFEKIINSE